MKTAEGLCKRPLGRKEEKRFKTMGGGKEEEQHEGKGEAEDCGSPNEISDFVRPKSDCELDEWEMEDQQSTIQDDGTQERRTLLDKTDIRPMGCSLGHVSAHLQRLEPGS